ncbi:hypothetical protein [Flavitalea sp.]|nr:hypothetical protein [Flavitalea sp.]
MDLEGKNRFILFGDSVDGTDKRVLTDNQFEEATPAWRMIKKEK